MRERRVVGVLPDVTGVDRIFSYEVPDELDALVEPGSIVRVPLGPRRVRGWVVEERAQEAGLDLRPIDSFVSVGATPDVLEVARFGAWRYCGRLRAFLVAATPDRIVRVLLERRDPTAARAVTDGVVSDLVTPVGRAVADALEQPVGIARLPPGTPRLEIVERSIAAIRSKGVDGSLLVLLPEHHDADRLVGLLRSRGENVASYPSEWVAARTGAAVVVGTRSAVLAPLERLSGIVVLDAHDEGYIAERTPTWRATVLAAERGRQASVPVLLVSATPSLDVLALGELSALGAEEERAGWPFVEVLDRRGDDPRAGLFAPTLAEIVRGAREKEPGRPVVAVLNRTGRARLLACVTCGTLATCERCGGALMERTEDPSAAGAEPHLLVCPRCALERPVICASCHSSRFRSLRIGVGRATEEFASLIGEPAVEVTAGSGEVDPRAGLLVGTEAVLHRARSASLVVFLDFDQELGAARLRASEHALSLIGRAGRLLGGRGGARGGFARRVVVQSRQPDHVVLRAAVLGEPVLVSASEAEMRSALRLPPFSAVAAISGEEADEVAALLGTAEGIEVGQRPAAGYLVRASDPDTLADALAEHSVAQRSMRVEVDPEQQ